MKIVAFLMALLLITLSIMPCADQGIAMKGTGEKAFSKNVADQQNDHPDDCSPFCHCSCCAGFSINHTTATIDITTSFTNSHAVRFLTSGSLQIASLIWQPPRAC